MVTEELLAAFEEARRMMKRPWCLKALATDEGLQEDFILSQRLDAIMEPMTKEDDILPVTKWQAESDGNLCDFQ